MRTMHPFRPHPLRLEMVVLALGIALCGFGCIAPVDSENAAASESFLEGEGPWTVCHIPPGNPDAAHTIEVGGRAIHAHLAHGDFAGPCGGDEEPSYSSQSVAFDGVDDYVDMGNVYTFYGLQPYSMCLWFKTDSVGEAHLMGQQNPGIIRRGEFVHLDDSGNVCFSRVANEFSLKARECTTTAPSLGTWHHVCATTFPGQDSFTSTHIYVDGVEAETTTEGQNLGNNSTANTGALFSFGAATSGSATTRAFQGNIDEAAMYLVQLTAAEVAAIYNGGSPDDLAALNPLPSSWWRMGECTTNNTTVCDEIVATAYDGMLVNGAAFSSDIP